LSKAAVAGGLIPSPSAIVVMLAAIAADRTVLGIALVLIFSVGLGTALVLVGVLSVHARSFVTSRGGTRVMSWLPVAGAAVIFSVGVVLTVQALAQPL
jgi:nickel/cobalt transporter (NicO) family protein